MSKKIIIKRRTTLGAKFKTAKKKGNGLPSFPSHVSSVQAEHSNSAETDDHASCGFEDLPCDALLALQSLQRSDQGLHIPLGNNRYIQAVLPSQIFQRFQEGHSSSIWSEILSLIASNQVVRLSCQDEGETILILTKDYMEGAQEALRQHESDLSPAVQNEIISWFLQQTNLEWTETIISHESLEDCWKDDIIVSPKSSNEEHSVLPFEDALQFLLQLRVLLPAPKTSTTTSNTYQLWLPQWGLVLKSWNEARQQLLSFIARSKGNEASEKNVLNQNRHRISTKFLLDELTYKGKLKIIERPFGRFIKKVNDKKEVISVSPKLDDTEKELPLHPSKWPQRPLILLSTPNSATKITGVRRLCDDGTVFEDFSSGRILPINGGQEVPGQSLVVEFESTHFVGAMIVRIKDASKLTKSTNYVNSSYFDGKKRTFQAVVKGQFKTALPMNHCVTGQTFDRSLGKLPPRWIVKSLISLVSMLAPHLEVAMGDSKSHFLAPLVATAQTVLVESSKDSASHKLLDEDIIEPKSTEKSSILFDIDSASSSLGPEVDEAVARRIKKRKRFFNMLSSKKAESPSFSTQNIYTFEFYQHRLDFQDGISIKMGNGIGNLGLAKMTDGQPIKLMSAYQDPMTKELETLWSFDIWEESFFRYAEVALNKKGQI